VSTSEPPEEGRRSPSAGSEKDEFDALVAGWKAEGTVPEWPDLPPAPAPVAPEPAPHLDPSMDSRPDPRLDPDDHYVPPEPPPLPRIGAAVAVGLVLVALGIVLIAAPQWIGMSSIYGLPLGLVSIAGGLTWLLMRLWQPVTTDDDPYDDEGTV
jgi:hypothetical protein